MVAQKGPSADVGRPMTPPVVSGRSSGMAGGCKRLRVPRRLSIEGRRVGVRRTVFLVRLLMGRSIGWGAQTRDDHVLPWGDAARYCWPQTLIGAAPVLLLAATAPTAIPYALFIAGGPLFSIPFAVWTSNPAVGRALIALGLDRLPEETAPPPELRALALPAIELTLAQAPQASGRSA